MYVPKLDDYVKWKDHEGWVYFQCSEYITIVFLSSEEERKRFDICLSCQYYESGRCSQCGCFMKVKVKFSTSKCPVGLW